MSVNGTDNNECWSLMVSDCDNFSACRFTVRMRLICLQNSSRHSAVDYAKARIRIRMRQFKGIGGSLNLGMINYC